MRAVVSAADGQGEPVWSDATTLTMTPATFWALARVADRHGPLTVSARAGRTLALVDTTGRLIPDVALEFDAGGQVVAKTLLTRPGEPPMDDGDDGLDDLGVEQPQHDAVLSAIAEGARLPKRCECPAPFGDGDGGCARCGHPLVHGLAA